MIDVQDVLDQISDQCDDLRHTREESLDAYEEIISFCQASATALREELRRR